MSTKRAEGKYRYGGDVSGFPVFLLITSVLTFILMMLGAYTKAVGAGLSCPDWPKCYGVWVPFLHPEMLANSNYAAGYSGLQIFVEWAHRGLAMIVGILILIAAVWAWKKIDDGRVKRSLGAAVVLLPFQIILGGLTVTENLQPLIVTSHLATATVIMISLTVATTVVYITKGGDRNEHQT
ncbi:MAG: heme A synthase [Halobacteria archaeon]